MGWGEPKGLSADLVERNRKRTDADCLAVAVRRHWQSPTTGNADAMHYWLMRYEGLIGPGERVDWYAAERQITDERIAAAGRWRPENEATQRAIRGTERRCETQDFDGRQPQVGEQR